LFLAFERSTSTWQRGFTTGSAQRPRERSVPARDVTAVPTDIARAKPRFGVPEEARVRSGYEAGRGRAKTDRLKAHARLTMLLRPHAGAQKV
jgi:hypothetical protein